jgi:hypothetical protein
VDPELPCNFRFRYGRVFHQRGRCLVRGYPRKLVPDTSYTSASYLVLISRPLLLRLLRLLRLLPCWSPNWIGRPDRSPERAWPVERDRCHAEALRDVHGRVGERGGATAEENSGRREEGGTDWHTATVALSSSTNIPHAGHIARAPGDSGRERARGRLGARRRPPVHARIIGARSWWPGPGWRTCGRRHAGR